MNIVEPGHVYDLDWLDGEPEVMTNPDLACGSEHPENRLIFVNREEGTEHGGTQTQEVLRALIDRTMHCDNCLRWPGNDEIIYHLRMALVLHEARALERHVEKGESEPERAPTGRDGHFQLADQDEPYSYDAAVYTQKEKGRRV